MSNLIKVDPKQFGLEEVKAVEINTAFAPKIAEREALSVIYNELLTKDITEEVSLEAGNLRKKLVKVRTGIASIHKTQKAFYLAAGKYVDAWKNKETLPVEQMESKLSDIEKYYEKLEAEKLAKLDESRADEIKSYLHDGSPEPVNLGSMSDDVWDNYLNGVKTSYELRIKAEADAEEKRIADEKEAEKKRLAEIERQKTIEKENARLKKEADKKESERLAELKKIEDKAKADKLERDRIAKIEADNQAKIKADLEAKAEEEKQARLKLEAEAKKEADKLKAELKAKEDEINAEKNRLAKIEDERLKAEKLASLAPEKEKVIAWINSMTIKSIATDGFSSDGIDTCNSIFDKFNAFKKWAESQVNNIN